MKLFVRTLSRILMAVFMLAICFQPAAADNPVLDTLGLTLESVYEFTEGAVAQTFWIRDTDKETVIYRIDIKMYAIAPIDGFYSVYIYNADANGVPTTPVELVFTDTTLSVKPDNVLQLTNLDIALVPGVYALVVLMNGVDTAGYMHIDYTYNCTATCSGSDNPYATYFSASSDKFGATENWFYTDSTTAMGVKISVKDPTAVTTNGLEVQAASGEDAWLARWETASEIDTLGFNLYTSFTQTGLKIRVNPELIPAKTPGNLMGNSYEYSLGAAPAGRYWWLAEVDVYGQETLLQPTPPTYRYFMPAMRTTGLP